MRRKMNNRQKSSVFMRQRFLDYVPIVVQKLKFLKKPVTLEAVRRLAKAKHVGFDLTDEDISQFTTPPCFTEQDLDFIQAQKLARDVVFAALGVPEDLLTVQLSLF
jgi:hypothetical protein